MYSLAMVEVSCLLNNSNCNKPNNEGVQGKQNRDKALVDLKCFCSVRSLRIGTLF